MRFLTLAGACRGLRSAPAFVFLILAACTPLVAQTTGSIYGTVTDESGAVVAGANVTAVNTLTNEERSTASNEVGFFNLPELPVGLYTVRVEFESKCSSLLQCFSSAAYLSVISARFSLKSTFCLS